MLKSILRCGLTSIVAMALAAPANAVSFTLIDTGGAGFGSKARAGFDAAAYFWSSVLGDSVNITLNIGFQSLGGDRLGTTSSSSGTALVSDVYSALRTDARTGIDAIAINNLTALQTVTGGDYDGLGQLGVTINRTGNAGTSNLSNRATRFDNDASVNNLFLDVNTANAKALGFDIPANPDGTPQIDGTINFSSDFAFDFDPTDGITTGSSDFIGVAIHEIGHALGFFSGVDSYDANTYDIAAGAASKQSFLDQFAVGGTLDLFRYNSSGELDWSTVGDNKFFSIDGKTSFDQKTSFSTGNFNGDGYQASHWKAPTGSPFCSGFAGIMNPYLCAGTKAVITRNDLAAFDAIGWDLNIDLMSQTSYTIDTAQILRQFQVSAVPEPASWMMMILGFGIIGGGLRHRRNSKRRVPGLCSRIAAAEV